MTETDMLRSLVNRAEGIFTNVGFTGSIEDYEDIEMWLSEARLVLYPSVRGGPRRPSPADIELGRRQTESALRKFGEE